MLGRRGISLLPFFFPLSNSPLTPIANLSSNSVSLSFKTFPTSGPQPLLQYNDCITHVDHYNNLLSGPPASISLFHPPVQTELPKTPIPSKHFWAENYYMDPHYSQNEVHMPCWPSVPQSQLSGRIFRQILTVGQAKPPFPCSPSDQFHSPTNPIPMPCFLVSSLTPTTLIF